MAAPRVVHRVLFRARDSDRLLAVAAPACHLPLLMAFGFVVNIFAAVQDVAVDGMAIDVLPSSEQRRLRALDDRAAPVRL